MKSSGNGSPDQCAINLLRISRGEVPYDRIKGLDSATIDSPASRGMGEAEADARWVLETYEPRIDVNVINVNAALAAAGDFNLAADIVLKEEEAVE